MKLNEVLRDYNLLKEKQLHEKELLEDKPQDRGFQQQQNSGNSEVRADVKNTELKGLIKVTATKVTVTAKTAQLSLGKIEEEPKDDLLDPSRNFFDILDKLTGMDSNQAVVSQSVPDFNDRHQVESQMIKQMIMERKKKEIQQSRLGLQRTYNEAKKQRDFMPR